MKFQLKSSSKANIPNVTADCIICTTSCLSKLNFAKNTIEYLNKILNQEELLTEISINKSILLFNVPGIAANRLLLVSTGKQNILSDFQFIDMIKNIATSLGKHNINHATLCINNCQVPNRSFDWQIYQTIITIQNSSYNFDYYKSKKNHKNKVNNIDFIIDNKFMSVANLALQQALAVSTSCKLAKDLANTPPNICTTNFMAKSAIDLSKKSSKIKLTILEKKDLEKLNMGAFLSVAQGSLQPPKLICLEYKGYKGSKPSKNDTKHLPIVLIGKGITFDTGGNSLKPANSMMGMKYDMCGAATVLGLINFAIEMQLNLNIVGIIATAENMPGRHASRPDDVVTTMSGITVEILNTDAEGRLILCEALTYCKKFNPKTVIDIATLTGACAAALGQHYSGLFSNDQELVNNLTIAGITSCDKVWQLPMTEEYNKQIDSDIADIANIGNSPYAGSITAACFLGKFATDYKWAHLDIAGTAYYSEGKINRHASGRPIPMLAQYLVNQIKKNPRK